VEVDPFSSVHARAVKTKYAVALAVYTPSDDMEMELQEGDGVWIIREDLSGWWYGQNARTGLHGWLPCGFVRLCAAPEAASDDRGSGVTYHGLSARSSGGSGGETESWG
jgi:hypothetical protein